MRRAGSRGFTLVELITAMAVSAVLVALVTKALIELGREQTVREVVTETQDEGRLGFSRAALDVRSAALGAPSGVLLVQDSSGNRVSRPAVQLFEDVAGSGFLPVKPHTDALLVAQALPSPRGAVRGDQFAPAIPGAPFVVTVTDVTGFTVGSPVMFGEYANAGWASVTDVDATNNRLTLSSTVNLYPGLGGKLPSGSLVRPARARLYYVSTLDQLVRVDLTQPIPPASTADLGDQVVLAQAFENLQLECFIDGGASGIQVCGGSSDPSLTSEASAAFGAATARVTTTQAPLLRLVRLSAVVHGERPLVGSLGDAPIALRGVTLAPAGASTDQGWVRRAYQLELAVRNTSLEAL
jgi:prepilin-type N-terminal cleavage/methylation domain-containing protein